MIVKECSNIKLKAKRPKVFYLKKVRSSTKVDFARKGLLLLFLIFFISGTNHFLLFKKKGSVYLSRHGVCKKTKTLFNPTITTNQNRFFNALLSMFVFGAHSRNWIAYTRTLWKWTGKLCRVKINLYNVNIGLSLTHDNYYRLQHLQKNMKAGILRNYICELTTTRIIVRGRIWLRRPMCILHCLVSETFTQGYFIVGSPFTTLGQH